MWLLRSEQLTHGCIIRVDLEKRPVTFVDVLARWQGDPLFRAFFTEVLANAPYSAFRWEAPPITSASASRPFEFALIDSPELDTEPDPEAFAEHFTDTASDDVVSFSNLNHDAMLVVPRPVGHLSAYAHLGAFVRKAPEAQKHALWRIVGRMMERQLGAKPTWLSTAGAGVPWLHVRLDQKPKYYHHAPYRQGSG